jgi:hypothetical protein
MTATTNDGLRVVEFFLPQTNKTIEFPAFLTSLSDNFTSNWNAEQHYGFQDPVGNFIGTSRKVSFGLRIIAASVADARTYQGRLNQLAASLYPTYSTNWTPKSSPLVGIKIDNIIQEDGGFLFGWLDGISLTPSVSEVGLFNDDKGMMPGMWELELNFNVIHKKRPGFRDGRFTAGSNFPVKVGVEEQDPNADAPQAVDPRLPRTRTVGRDA